jgi:RNA 2',3'-cyclic 3'-phosphodiesterase
VSADARLFVAVDLPAPIRAELARWTRWALEPGEPAGARGERGRSGRGRGSAVGRPGRAPSDGIRRVDAQALHITLCFLGDQPLERVDEIGEVVAGALADLEWRARIGDGEPPAVHSAGSDSPFGGAGAGGGSVGALSIGAPVWLPPRRPRALALEVHDESGGLASLYEGLRVGLGAAIGWEPERRRFRPHITVARLRSWAPAPACVEPTPAIAFEPESVTVYRSRLAAEGATYDALVRVACGGGSGVREE